MNPLPFIIPNQINTGPWLVGYTLNELKQRSQSDKIVLPICSLGTPIEQLQNLAPLVLPPLYHEALNDNLKPKLLTRIHQCFPYFEGTRDRREQQVDFEIVELPPEQHSSPIPPPKVLAFSVDTAVEEHGPHIPLATDTIQSYGVLDRLAREIDGFIPGPPVEYGHLTWGLPFGMSIDITPPLVTEYVTGFTNALLDWLNPAALYVVDVHGSIVHRNAIQEGLKQSRCSHWSFRWLHEPLVEFAADRGDQHAGGVETALVELISPELVDNRWWPERIDQIAAEEMSFNLAVELTPDLPKFIEYAESHPSNGIVGNIRNYNDVNAEEMMTRMLDMARDDVQNLIAGH